MSEKEIIEYNIAKLEHNTLLILKDINYRLNLLEDLCKQLSARMEQLENQKFKAYTG
jgi:hypothetical protein